MRRIVPQNFRKYVLRLLIVAGYFVAFATVQPAARAQEKTTLRRIEITGLQRLSPDEVIASTGLRVGDLIDARAIDAAAAKLMNSGRFTSVNYRVQTADSDSTVIFEVAEKAGTSNPPTVTDLLGSVSWTGNHALTNQELANAFSLRTGDQATRPKIDQGLDAVRKAYARQGYINAQMTESSTRNGGRANYEFTVHEGQQYRMGLLTIVGLSAAEAQQLKSKWTLAPGTVFDDSYLDQFRSTVIRPFVTSRTQRTGVRSKFDVSSKPDLQKLAIDVIIAFK